MTNTSLGSYLKLLRKKHNYSQEFVASKLNIIRQTYSHYETGRIQPPVDSLYRLSVLYQIPPERLLKFIVHDDDDFPVPTHDDMLTAEESRLISYYRLLDRRDQEDILAFTKIKSERASGKKIRIEYTLQNANRDQSVKD